MYFLGDKTQIKMFDYLTLIKWSVLNFKENKKI